MRAVCVTNRGGRENNEDCVRYAHSGDTWCFALCDGLGGHECGEVASETVADAVRDEFLKNPQISEEAIRDYLAAAAELLYVKRQEDDDKYNMATTVAALVTDGVRAVWAHVGDSRLYHISEGKIFFVTDDHSVAFMEYQSGAIEYDEIRKSPNQNKLTRCVGDIDAFLPDISPVEELKDGDAFLLCSDGFWEYVTEDDITAAFRESPSPKEWLQKMLDTLHKNETENNDNYSAIAVMV